MRSINGELAKIVCKITAATIPTPNCHRFRGVDWENEANCGVISFPVASELILPEIRTRQYRFPTINPGRDTALPCPLYHSGAAGIDISSIVLYC